MGWGRDAGPAVHSGQALHPAPAVGQVLAQANGLKVARGALTEWHVNGPLGLQQVWTVREPPPGPAEAPLTLAYAQSGSLRGYVDGDRRGLLLAGTGGAAQWRYAGLQAYDATGRRLPAWIDVEGERVLVQVDDAGAAYPLEVDTWVQAAKLTASDAADSDRLGLSVAVSADGSTVVAGARYRDVGGNSDQGAVYVYSRPETGWADATETARLIASDGAAGDHLGESVAVSGDGGTVVAGAPNHYVGGNYAQGAVYVYIRPDTGWANATQTAKLTASDGAYMDFLGCSVAVSEGGSTVVVGASGVDVGGNSSQGAVYVYSWPGTGWADATETAKLTASDGADQDSLGNSVAVSGDGGTVVAGAPWSGAGGSRWGAVYVYARPGTGWMTTAAFTAKLTASDGADGDELGYSVAVSGDGGTVVAGAPGVRAGGSRRGAAYVFSRPETGWATTAAFTAKLAASDRADDDELGRAMAVSGDGGTVVAGAPSVVPVSPNRPGAVYVYRRPETGWADATETAKLIASDGAAGDNLGESVAMSGDGNTVVGGAPYNSAGGSNRGAAYVWAVPNTPPTAAFTVTPASGDTSTVFQFDASGCTDMEDPPSLLEVRWDWEDDGAYDTPWSPAKTASHSYAGNGTYTIRLEVMDGGGLTGSTTRQVMVGAQAPAHRVYLPLVVRNYP
jgi:hypothetical protein